MSRESDFHSQYPAEIETVSRLSDGTHTVDFKPGVPQNTRDSILAALAAFNFKPSAATKFRAFILAVSNDSGGVITANNKRDITDIAQWFLMGEKQIALSLWNLVKAGMTAQQLSAVSAHAAANNVTLP